VTLSPDEPPDPGGDVALTELFAADATGEVFKLIMEFEAPWAKMVNLQAGVY
jgi:hypothetical protein